MIYQKTCEQLGELVDLTPRVINGRWYDHREEGYTAVLFRDPCAYCGGRTQVLDHIHPASAGGLDSVDNLTGACQGCNLSKSNRSLLGFLGYRINKRDYDAKQALLDQQRRGWKELGRTL